MPEIKNYGRVSQLINAAALPSAFGAAQDMLGQILDRIAYHDLVIEKSATGDRGYYAVTCACKELSTDLLGSGLKLIYFPAQNPDDPESQFDVAFEYSWPIRKYFPEFETLNFAGSAKAFFDIFTELADISEADFLTSTVACFIASPTPYQDLVDKLKLWGGSSSPLAGLTLANQPFGLAEIEYILDQVTAANVDIFEATFDSVLNDLNDVSGSIEKIVALFQRWLGAISREDLENLLLPQFSVELRQIAMAIEVPRSVLVPIDSNNLEIADPAHSRLTFTAGSIRYDSRAGFDIAIDTNIAAALSRSMVPGFGLTLDFDDIKVDLSRTTNIAEADADGRPVDFMGIYIGNAVVGLPEKWFAHYQPTSGPPVTLGIVGRQMLIGTGGVTGTIGLEALSLDPTHLGKPDPNGALTPAPNAELVFVLGKQPTSGARKGFKIGFSSFDLKFRQNVLLESSIKGSLTIPKFQTAPIAIELFLSHDGDFEVTASTPTGHNFTWAGVFTFKAHRVKVGKEHGKVFLELSGDLIFDANSVLGTLIKKPIALDRLLIHSDGSMELKGGEVPLPESVALHIGPAKIAITALHFGSHMQDRAGVMREYRYFGLDAAVSIDPGRCGGRGDGIKFYYTVDDDLAASPPRSNHQFLRIEGLGIDLCIPGSASEGEAALILKGYLALKDPVYEGSISFKLMKGKIVGGASMKYDTSYPAWLVDANLNLPKAIPLGSTPLGISSLRGMFGLRYVAAKEAIVPPLANDASWGDYFRAEQDIKGVTYKKFVTPDDTNGASNPFSVGVGVGLITQADNGKLFSAQLFLMVSLPNLIMLEGRADILGDHAVAVDDDPPYYAYLALSPETIEMGAGVNYRLPKDSGEILDLNAVMEAAYFFHDASAWYMHLGTKAKPVTARIISLFDGYSYLMLSASGIEMGAGVHFDVNKTYGPVSVSAHAYLDTWAYIAFEKFQAGGGIAMGGYIDARLFKFGLYIELAALLTVEVPKPFYVAGSVHICVSVNLKFKTFSTCFDMQFKWEKPRAVDRSPVAVLPVGDNPASTAQHMVSGTTYPVEFSANAEPLQDKVIPLDCYVDVKFTKPVDPSAVAGRIGGYTSPPVAQLEAMPPRYGSRVVHHAYALKDVQIDIRDGSGNWVSYHPYRALAQEALLDPQTVAQLDTLPLGVWQKQDPTYSQIRFLGQTPFSWMGAAIGFCPEEIGVTPTSTYCVARERQKRCLVWPAPENLVPGTDYYREGILYCVEGSGAEAVTLVQTGLSPVSLAIAPGGTAQFRFPERAVQVDLILYTTAPSITVRWQRRTALTDVLDGQGQLAFTPWIPPQFEDIGAPIVLPRSALATPLAYDDPANPVDRLLIETPAPDLATIQRLEDQIARLHDDWVRADAKSRPAITTAIAKLEADLLAERNKACIANNSTDSKTDKEIAALTSERNNLGQQLAAKQDIFATSCTGVSGSAGGTIMRATESASAPGIAITRSAATPAAVPPAKSFFGRLVDLIRRVIAGMLRFLGLAAPPTKPPAVDCRKLADEIKALQDRTTALQSQIHALQRQAAQAAASRFPLGWTCGTFVHNVCWLSLSDHAFNQTIPGLAAIAADYDRMRSANQETIAPIWAPRHTYRITLKTSDTVTDENNQTPPGAIQTAYVHFRTEGPIGFFDAIPLSDQMTPAPLPNAPRAAVPDDGRPEMPERALKFYIDSKSTPDATGDLLYAQPTYYRDVVLRLFFSAPYAYHFFAHWPDVGDGPRHYALELAIKDPAEAVPPLAPTASAPPHQALNIGGPLLGQQTWEVDAQPRITSEITTIRTFQNPVPTGNTESLVCLTTGGDPITPLSKSLKVAMGDLEPAKLYTAVVLNRCLDDNTVAEVARYPFRTSIYPDFATHIASYQLQDNAQNGALAVFALEHDLAPALDEAAVLTAARAIVTGQPSTDTAAYSDSFDRLIYGQLRLASPAPALTVEFNFVVNAQTQHTYGLWIRSPEPLIDPRVPKSLLDDAVRVIVAGVPLSSLNAPVLFSKDRSQAFVMISSGSFPTQDLTVAFTRQSWNGNAYDAETVTTGTIAKP